MALYPTPHIAATPDDIAKTILMPGDPLRSRFIAQNFLTDAKLFNDVRGVQGYTGTYKGTRVSVMASGMGIPSIGIYSYELYNVFDVDNIIRVGSAGAIRPEVQVRDVVIAMGASTNSNFADQFHLPGTYSAICDFELLRNCVDVADEMKLKYKVGNLLSEDNYYKDEAGTPEVYHAIPAWSKMGLLAIEMEAAGLYMNAARAGKKALAICTISNNILTGEELPPVERETSFTEMIELALNTAVKMDK